MADQSVHERELVGVFLARRGIAVGAIDAGEPRRAALRRDHRFDIARLLVMRIAGQAARDLDRPLGENRDAVEGLLPVRGDVVAEVLHLGARKRLVEALDLLQAQRVGAPLLEIVEQMRQALADRIDVPGGDDQGRLPRLSGSTVWHGSPAGGKRSPQRHRRCAQVHCSGASRMNSSKRACSAAVAAATSASRSSVWGTSILSMRMEKCASGRRMTRTA